MLTATGIRNRHFDLTRDDVAKSHRLQGVISMMPGTRKQLVEGQGGRVLAESKISTGTKFSIESRAADS